jgi:hypothetical protein
MERIKIKSDIKVFCVQADSFPEGVQKAHQALHTFVPFSDQRNYFGLSRMENGKIIYIAAAEEFAAMEFARHGLQQLTVPAGEYQCIVVTDFMKNITKIGAAFDRLIQLPDIDPEGYCVKWYVSDKDVRCMVRVV